MAEVLTPGPLARVHDVEVRREDILTDTEEAEDIGVAPRGIGGKVVVENDVEPIPSHVLGVSLKL